MQRIILPFPAEPDAAYAQSITDAVIPALDTARYQEFLAAAQNEGRYLDQERHPEFDRDTGTDRFRNDALEATVQLGIAFYAFHGKQGFSCDPSAQESNPKRYALQKHLHRDTKFVEWMQAEVSRRRRGPEPHLPTEREERIRSLIEALRRAFGGSVVVLGSNLPSEEPIEDPSNTVLAHAVDYYRYVVGHLME